MFNEPPYTERYVRWCERSVSEIITHLLLDSQPITYFFVMTDISKVQKNLFCLIIAFVSLL